MVEIPERDHALGERAVGLTDSQRALLRGFVTATAQLVAHGQKVDLQFYRLWIGAEKLSELEVLLDPSKQRNSSSICQLPL